MRTIKTVSKTVNDMALSLYVQGKTAVRAAASKLREKDGSFFTEQALVVVIVVVIAGIVLTAMVFFFKDKVFPSLNNKTDEFFAIS